MAKDHPKLTRFFPLTFDFFERIQKKERIFEKESKIERVKNNGFSVL